MNTIKQLKWLLLLLITTIAISCDTQLEMPPYPEYKPLVKDSSSTFNATFDNELGNFTVKSVSGESKWALSKYKYVLMNGKSENEVKVEGMKANKSDEEIRNLAPFKVFAGNKPTNSFLLKEINPHSLGMLIALYEHKIFVQGVIWNIFSFDQWGVELGKQMANKILPELLSNDKVKDHDSSTNGLINAFKEMSKK